MRRQLIRAALLLYPSGWRRRYGGELEQMMLDYGADDGSLAGSARMLIELTGSGLVQRARSTGSGTRIATVACLCAAVGIAVDAGTLATSTSNNFAVNSYDNITFAADALVPPHMSEIHEPVIDLPGTWEREPSAVTVYLFRGTSHIIGMGGPPMSIVLNPHTNKVLSVKLAGAGARARPAARS